ncbi:protein involved in sex pheromone biosynthesis [Kribbella aluminosa]|uniref:Protein involved in sex pheromone biosynthesis n=1 Tax=Kribbella aluminosa TaxID=416017 RepID=A0ABS4UM46_9ACTN|nr:protein involved in sex pheromone biosynthesis [Kribbella aluminosa]
MQSMGSLSLWISLRPGIREVDDFRKELRQLSDEITLPALELFSEGLFVERSMLDEYLMYVCDPPAGDAKR